MMKLFSATSLVEKQQDSALYRFAKRVFWRQSAMDGAVGKYALKLHTTQH